MFCIKNFSNILKFRRYFANNVTKAAQLPEITSIPINSVSLPKTEKVTFEKVAEISPTFDPFDDIPGPQILRYTTKLLTKFPISPITIQYFMASGSQIIWDSYPTIFKRLFDEYGPVVRLYGPFGGDVVIVARPEYIKEVFKSETPFPIKSGVQSLERYRLEYRKMQFNGPLLTITANWENLKKNDKNPPSISVNQYIDQIDDISNKFTERAMECLNKQSEVGKLKKLTQQWCLECLFAFAINKRLGFLDPCGVSSTSDAGILIENLNSASQALQTCEKWGFHVWKMITPPVWTNLIKSCDSIDWILGKYIQRAHNSLNERKSEEMKKFTLLESLLLFKNGVTAEDVLTVMLDLLLVGVNTTTHIVNFLLYYLAKYPRCQNILRDSLQNGESAYLKACIKETLRLKAPFPLFGRILTEDIILYNYHIPKNTHILMITNLDNVKEEYFDEPYKFKPERWMGKLDKEFDLFSTIPYGVGEKSLFAKQLMLTEINSVMTKIMDKFTVKYYYGDINTYSTFLANSRRDIKLRFLIR